ncbi:MAG: hypothetical protein U9Q81_11300 [Pseudomonadota bacterium]|nr:hypothetical protein [Pseudomonadota bacterium]
MLIDYGSRAVQSNVRQQADPSANGNVRESFRMDIDRQQVQIDALSVFLDSIQSFHNYLVQAVQPDQRFFHYTDLSALSSIVSNHDIWLTNSRYSNDRDEVSHGYRIAKEVVEKQLRSEKRKRPKNETLIEYVEAISILVPESKVTFPHQNNLLQYVPMIKDFMETRSIGTEYLATC